MKYLVVKLKEFVGEKDYEEVRDSIMKLDLVYSASIVTEKESKAK